MAALFMKLCNSGGRMLLSVMGSLAAMMVFYQFWVFPSRSYFSPSSCGEIQHPLIITVMKDSDSDLLKGVEDNADDMGVESNDYGLTSDPDRSENNVVAGKDQNRVEQVIVLDNTDKDVKVLTNFSTIHGEISMNKMGFLGSRLNISATKSSSSMAGIKQVVEMEVGSRNGVMESTLRNESLKIERYVRRMRGATITLSEMKSMLLKAPTSSTSMRRRGSVERDRELLFARLQIENAPVLRNFVDLHAPLFRNVSMFKRSYELMERLVKIYVYKEGEKPIFHQSRLRGLYSAEGWFMKLLERSKHFTVRDPKKAHLYYLPFSSETLRMTLYKEKSHSIKNLEDYLSDYVDLIKKKYRFWNRSGGADHFFVACHDWAPRITRQYMSSCIRALCNANAARGFTIGKDVSVPVTYIRSGNDPVRDIGGKPPSEREILAFFAGSMHGYLRPLLLQYWENKSPDMKIFGPMQRDIEGKRVYREFMKTSKYCICARGYGVHTPRVFESIFYECVPVIVSDNYVPPFFEVLNWEAFAVFVQEKDVPNLRNILLSISEDRYLEMQMRVKMLQRHFAWSKIPEKYDLFHMILHSIWYSRVLQVRR